MNFESKTNLSDNKLEELTKIKINSKLSKAADSLREDKVLYYLQGQNSPMEDYKKRGYFVVNASLNTNKDKSYPQTFVTPKGLDWLRKRYCDAAGKNTAT